MTISTCSGLRSIDCNRTFNSSVLLYLGIQRKGSIDYSRQNFRVRSENAFALKFFDPLDTASHTGHDTGSAKRAASSPRRADPRAQNLIAEVNIELPGKL